MTINYKGHTIFAFADTHGMYRRLEVPAEADILICAGDACEGFAPADLQDFFGWYAAVPASLRIFVAGNHDMIFDSQPDYARSLVPDGIVLLENSGIEFDGITFYSVSARPYLKTPVSLPLDLDFLITHGPAYGHLDCDEGDKQLFLSITAARPRYHIFGHVHEEGLQRKAMLGGTTFLNVSYFEELRRNLER
jgi:predicted phosphodiesterase